MKLFGGGAKGRKRSLRFILVTASLVAGVFAFYYFHFHGQLENIHKRNLRFLATMSTQIEATLQSYVSVVTSLGDTQCEEGDPRSNPEHFLDSQTSMYIYRPPATDLCEDVKWGGGKCFAIQQDLEQVSWLLLHDHGPACKNGNSRKPVHAKANLYSEFEFFMPALGSEAGHLVPADDYAPAFESILIADSSGTVIYQPPHAQLHLSNLRPLFAPPPAAPGAKEPPPANRFDDIRQTSTLTSVEVAGLTYDYYSQPIRLSAIQKSDWGNGNGEWVLVGLARPRDSYKQAMRVPYPWLFAIINGLVLCFLSLPWLRVRFLARHERLRRRDVVFSGVSAFMSLAVALSPPVYYYTIRTLRADAENQIEKVAKSVQTFLKQDLRDIVQYAQAANTKLLAPGQHARVERLVLKKKIKDSAGKDRDNPGYVNNPYPFADLVFWTNNVGKQLYKWSAYPDVSPFIDVTTEQFFLESQGEYPARLKLGPGNYLQFFLNGQLARTTGTYKAIIGLEEKEKNLPATRPSNLFVVAQPRSLFRVVIPPGTAFCLVDRQTGETIFHSDYRRDRNENLFRETDESPALRAAIFAGHGMVEADYGGRRDLAYVTKIDALESSPLVLVVFADRLIYETTAALIASLTVFLHVLYAALTAVVLGLIWIGIRVFVGPLRIIEAIWPRPASLWKYYAISATMLAHIVAFSLWAKDAVGAALGYGALFTCILGSCIVLFTLSPKWKKTRVIASVAAVGVLVTSISILFMGVVAAGPALAALAVTVVACASIAYFSSRIPPNGSTRRMLSLYTAAILFTVVGLSVAPAIAFFRVAFRYEATLMAQYTQKRLGDSIRERQSAMNWLETSDRLDDDLREKWDQIVDGYGHPTAGLYYDAFYNTVLTLREPRGKQEAGPPMECQFANLLAALHSPLNSIAIRMRAVAAAETDPVRPDVCKQDSPWWPADPRGSVAYFTSTLDGKPLRLESIPPATDLAETPKLLLPMLLICALYFYGLRSGARRIFALDWWMPKCADPDVLPPNLAGNYLALIRPSAPDDLFASRTDLDWVDLAQHGASSAVDKKLAAAGRSGRPVGVRNFDFAAADVEFNQWKLKWLERLVLVDRVPVVLVSCIDPSYYFDSQSEISENVRKRWRELFRGFTRLNLQSGPAIDRHLLIKTLPHAFMAQMNPGLPHSQREELARYLAKECGTDQRLAAIAASLPLYTISSKGEILAELERSAAAYYGYLWDTCSHEEQVLLHQIAKTRFANPLAILAAWQLHRKGLITDNPTEWIMNRSFASYLRSLPDPEPIAAPDDELGRDSIEQGAIVVLAAVALPLVIALAASQGEPIQGILGIVSAALATLGSITKLLLGKKAGPSP